MRRVSSRRVSILPLVVLALLAAGLLACRSPLSRPATHENSPEILTAPTPYPTPFSSEDHPTNNTPEPTFPDEPKGLEIAVGPPVPATDYAGYARMFDEERAMEHVVYLASDELGGRQPGAPGGRAAGESIAAHFAEYGLQPGGPDGTYFQTFTVPYGSITQPPVLSITLPNGEALNRIYAYRTDYRALTGGYLGAGEGEGPVVWLDKCLHANYAGLDMVGKVALCRHTGDIEIYRQAIEHQVGGLLLLDRGQGSQPFRRGGYRETAWVPQTIPAYLISERVANDLLTGTEYTLDDLSLRLTATPLSTTVKLSVAVEEREAVQARNVLGLLPGCDPARSDELVILGAHYDHLGREPDRVTVMNGANDNASGVATVLEIARLWRAQGLCPARSVLFAAWDGEEQGLLGSRHYVEHPTLPLTRTVAMLNLDMVGAGEALHIDGEGTVATQLQASAETYGFTATVISGGRSDHVSFHAAGVPAAMLIWWPDAVYHTPGDEAAVIEPQKLKTVGVLSAHTLAALAQEHVEVERAVARLRSSIAVGDRQAFLEGLDPTAPDLRAAQAAWFDDLWARELTEVTMEPSRTRVADGRATVTLRLAYRWADATQREPSVSYDAHFIQRNGMWSFAGYETDVVASDAITVARFSDVPVDARRLLSTTQEAYLSLAADLGLAPITGTRFIYYPDAETMRTLASPGAGSDTHWLVPSPGLAQIAWSSDLSAATKIPEGAAALKQHITPALVNLALTQMGLPPGEGAWLRKGLALQYADGNAAEYLPLLAHTKSSTPLLNFDANATTNHASPTEIPSGAQHGEGAGRACAWSAVEYLLERHGTDGLRRLCEAWGRNGDPATSFRQALGLSPMQFEAAWRRARLEPLQADAAAIQAALAARAAAVQDGDVAGFLSTVNPDNPALYTEERNWGADLADRPLTSYTATGQVIGWSPGGDDALVALSVDLETAEKNIHTFRYDARFLRRGERWLYDGVAWRARASEHMVLKYQDLDDEWARHALDLAEMAYDQVIADLDASPPLPMEIKLYNDEELLRASISPSLPDRTTSRIQPGESIRLHLPNQDNRSLQRTIARELTRQILAARGLETGWLQEGTAVFEAGRVTSLGTHWMAGRYMPLVQEAVRRHTELPLEDLLSWQDDAEDHDQADLFRAQSWSIVSFIFERYGLPGLQRLIAESIPGNARRGTSPVNSAGESTTNPGTALGVDWEALWSEWRAYARRKGVPDDLAVLAQTFDSEHALNHIAVLSSPEYGGRQAGTDGADLAASYIAEQFATLGLLPLGDPLTTTAALTETSPLTGATAAWNDSLQRGYRQRFPISHTHLITVPTLTLLDSQGIALHQFAYRKEFVENAGQGTVQGELVWAREEGLADVYFGGAVVLQRDVRNPIARAKQLQEHGAGGLIIATDKEAPDLQGHHVRHTEESRKSDDETGIHIPVFEITQPALEILLDRLGMTPPDLATTPSVLPLGAEVQQTLVRLPVTTTLTANVVALLPGSDPDLVDEVLLVGAHYDHIGQSPDGVYFPGANRNGSGVSAMLEMARAWQTAGYRPARSVLFAAWGAEELGSGGVTHYLAQPAVPLTRTVGVIALDSIAGGKGHKLLFYGTQEHDLPLIQRAEASAGHLGRRAWRRGSTGEGWQVSFSQAGIPTLKLIWDEAQSAPYQLTDTADAIDPERVATSGEILTLTAAWLASR